jgi:hypothetical protein
MPWIACIHCSNNLNSTAANGHGTEQATAAADQAAQNAVGTPAQTRRTLKSNPRCRGTAAAATLPQEPPYYSIGTDLAAQVLWQLERRLKHVAVLAEGYAAFGGIKQAADDVPFAVLLAVRVKLTSVTLLACATIAKACSSTKQPCQQLVHSMQKAINCHSSGFG